MPVTDSWFLLPHALLIGANGSAVSDSGWLCEPRHYLIRHCQILAHQTLRDFASMRFSSKGSLALLFAIIVAVPAIAQQKLPPDQPAQTATAPSLTGKERLGRKWMDEQRIDNCKVPPEKRGTRPRSSTCPHVPMG